MTHNDMMFYLFVISSLLIVEFTDAFCSVNCRYGADHCDSSDSRCLYGCEPGYTGTQCNIHCDQRCLECEWKDSSQPTNCTLCEPGYYGTDCQNNCSENCLFGPSKCDKDGNCIYGCNIGWHGQKCGEQQCDFTDCVKCGVSYHSNQIYCLVCKTGKFWNPFSGECVPCSNFCVNGNLSCNATTGICFHGCQPGYFGSNCDKYCSIANCSQCQESFGGSFYCARCEAGHYITEGRCEACSSHCKNGSEVCDKQTGKCNYGCKHGWFGDRCTEECTIHRCLICKSNNFINGPPVCQQCEAGYYWNENKWNCSACSLYCLGGQSACSSSDGTCTNGCIKGRYGQQCEWLCSQYCIDNDCYSRTGHCIHGCKDGWFGDYCDRNCPIKCAFCSSYLESGKCSECQSGWYGDICEKQCNENCKRSNYNNYLYCNKTSGKCSSGCNAGYYGDFCNLTCSEHCSLGECHNVTGKCTFPCSTYRYGDYCEKQCSHQCFSSPDDWKPCNQISGICVRGCNNGYYGDFCNKTCSSKCQNSTCSRVSGICSKGCISGYHGNYCNKTCNSNCNFNVCDQRTAECVEGCTNGMFGRNCSYQCSTKCTHSSCNQTTGFCSHGCVAGFHGDTCENICDSFCYNATCRSDGFCSVGCVSGREGNRCQQVCSVGFYGRNCEEKCGYCKDKTVCDPVTGICQIGCQVGWTGLQCDLVVQSAQEVSETKSDNKIIVASSATAAILFTVLVIVAVAVLVKRGRHLRCSKKRHSTTTFDHQEIQQEQTFGFTPHTTNQNADAVRLSSKENQFQLDMHSLQIHEEPALLQQKHYLCQIRSGIYKNCQVMVKVLKKGEEDNNTESLRKFQRELDVLKNINTHQNIVNVFGFCHSRGILYHVFESCNHGNLKRYLQDLCQESTDVPALTFHTYYSELIRKTLDILSGLMFLQEKQIIHRFIAAQNIFLDKDEVCRIGNFYFAVKEGEDCTAESLQVPEDFKPWLAIESRRRYSFSFKSDLWSFGVLLWEITSLGQDLINSSEAQREIIYPPPPDGCDRNILRLMESCWRASPSSRPCAQELFNRISAIKYKNKVLDTEEVEIFTTVV